MERSLVLLLLVPYLLPGLWVSRLHGATGVATTQGDFATALKGSWDGYKRLFIQADGRVIRRDQNDDTVSEGQALALLRAVWLDDQPTFDRCYQWVLDNLSRQKPAGDHLLAWHWGKSSDAKWGILDETSAADADEDYALALIFASVRWGSPAGNLPEYFDEARKVLEAILTLETRKFSDGRLFIGPGPWPESLGTVLNPSYCSPAWYRIFYQVSGDHRWLDLVESSYFMLESVSRRLGNLDGVGLPPDWCTYKPGEGFAPAQSFGHDFTWDAVRVPWRIGLDYVWFGEKRARNYFAHRMAPFLLERWAAKHSLCRGYAYSGDLIDRQEGAAAYAMYYFCFSALAMPSSRDMFEELMKAYHPDEGYFQSPHAYFENTFAWLGVGLHLGTLRNYRPATSASASKSTRKR